MAADRFQLLLERYQSGEAAPDEVAELETLLRADPANRRCLVEWFLMDVQLRKVFAGGLPLPKATAAGRRSRRWWAWAAAAVVILAVGALLLVPLLRGRSDFPEIVAGRIQIGGATVVRIPAGVPFEVVGDASAVIRLPDGSRTELEPASKAALLESAGAARQGVELSAGGGTFEVAHGGGEFRVETPAGTVTALGTEFTARLRAPRKARAGAKGKLALAVAVKAGAVRVDAGGRSDVLSAGKSRVFGDDGDQNNRDDGQQNNRNDGGQNNSGQNEGR